MTDAQPYNVLSLPSELLQQIAIHAPTIIDVLAFACARLVLYEAVMVPMVFRTRVQDAGWDLQIWDEDASDLTDDQALRIWVEANNNCETIVSMLETAAYPQFFERKDPGFQVWVPRLSFTPWSMSLHDCGEDEEVALDNILDRALINGDLVWVFLVHFVVPFNHILTHHVSHNLNKVLQLGSPELWQVVLRVIVGMVHNRNLPPSRKPPVERLFEVFPDLPSDLRDILDSAFRFEVVTSTFMSFIFLIGDAATLSAMFEDIEGANMWSSYVARHWSNSNTRFTHERIFGRRTRTIHRGDFASTVAETRRFSSSFTCMLTLYLSVCIAPAEQDSISLPRVPPMQCLSVWQSTSPRHGLHGTPLAGLTRDGEHQVWAGYYGFYTPRVEPGLDRDPPMLLELRATRVQEELLCLSGEGQDSTGAFSLSVNAGRRTGLFDAVKSYTDGRTWDWAGCVTPYGLIGQWGDTDYGGPVWIWPREWSE